MSFAAELRRVRLKYDCGVRELARRIGKSSGYIGAAECGIFLPSPPMLHKIIKALALDQSAQRALKRSYQNELLCRIELAENLAGDD